MQAPALPENEKARLAALRELGILDTPPEEVFDDFTFLASNICNTPIALITLVDEARQWFKSYIGIDINQTSREVSFCGRAVLQNDIFEVPDALSDACFMQNPLVVNDPRIRFYAGMPIQTKEGFNVGTLCVIDRVPRKLNEIQRSALKRLARQVMAQIELKLTFKNNQQLNQTLSETVRFSKNIIDNIPARIGYWDNHLICKYANKTYAEKYINEGIDIVGKKLFEAVSQELAEQINPHIEGVLHGIPQQFETSVLVSNHQTLQSQVNYIPDIDQHGNIKGFYIFSLDISALRRAEEENKLAETLIETSNVAVLIADKDHYIISVNEQFSKMTGYSQEELIGKHPVFIFDDEATEDAINTLSKQTFWRGESTYRKKNGEIGNHLATAAVLTDQHGKVRYHVATIVDLSEKKHLQHELAISQEMLERTGKIANVGGWEYDFLNNKIRWTDQTYAIYELETREPPDYEYAVSFYTEESRPIIHEAILKCIEFGTPWDLELPFITAKGNPIWVRSIGGIIKKNGEKIRLAGTFQDVTAKKLQEQATLAREVELRKTVVREVHHHIKNNIQGLSGILYNAIHQYPELSTPINEAISQLQSVAIIHGLQGKSIESFIEVCELTLAISQNIQNIWQTEIHFTTPEDWTKCFLSKNEAVPIALILNELITNAEKHRISTSPVTVLISQKITDENLNEVSICINNDGNLAFKCNPDQNTGNFGLKLIQSLMPKTGAYLYFSCRDHKTQAVLTLKQPIVSKNLT